MILLKIMTIAGATFFATAAYSNSVDLSASSVKWVGSKVVGSSHNGQISLKSADIKFTKGEPQSAKIIVDMTSITNADVKDAKWNAKLVGHLNSADFFDTAKHKTATFEVVKFLKADDKNYVLSGNLTIKGKTLPAKFKAKVTNQNKKSKTVKVDFTFDRTKYGIKYGSGSFFTDLGDKMISDDVSVAVELKIKS